MPSPRKARLVPLPEIFAVQHPDRSDLDGLVTTGSVFVDGRPVDNVDARIPRDATVQVRADAPLRGCAKLDAALAAFGVAVDGRIALDAGAAAGGPTGSTS